MQPSTSTLELAEELAALYQTLKAEIHKVIIGQDDIIRQLMMTILARGHCLMVGVRVLQKPCLSRAFPKFWI